MTMLHPEPSDQWGDVEPPSPEDDAVFQIAELTRQRDALLAACRTALHAEEFRVGTRKRSICRSTMTAELRGAIALAEGSPIAPEEAGYSEGQAAYIRLCAAAPKLLEACESALSLIRSTQEDDTREADEIRATVALAKGVKA